MLTLNGAWQLGLENERGSIAVGKWADFVLADQDVFSCAATEIGKTKVVSTWFEGVKFIANPTLEGETAVDLDAAGGVTNGVKFIWNAAADLPAGFKAGGVQVKVTAER